MTVAYPLFILTMPGDDARRARLEAWLQARGIGYELFFGIDGRGGLDPEWEPSINRAAAAARLGRTMGDGEFACALSHQAIYRTVLERGLPGAVVLEDDAVPTEAFVGFLAERGYARAPMILLDHSNTRVARGGIDLGQGVVGHPVALSPFLANGYSLNFQAAAYLRAQSFPISFVADWPCDLDRISALAAVPRLVGHPMRNVGPSHLEAERQARQHRASRFLTMTYWRRWWRKHRAALVPDENSMDQK